VPVLPPVLPLVEQYCPEAVQTEFEPSQLHWAPVVESTVNQEFGQLSCDITEAQLYASVPTQVCALAVTPYKVRKPSNTDKKQFRMKFIGVYYLVKNYSIILYNCTAFF
jgi:hypothetical protein